MNNPITMFVKDFEDDIVNNTTQEVYLAYASYCRDAGMNALGKIEFSRQLCKKFGFESVRRRIDGKQVRIFVKKDKM